MMSSNKFQFGSNQYETEGLSSNKKKLNTPALLFCKSNGKQNKFTNQNNSSVINTNKSPIRQLQMQKAPIFQRNSPLNSKDNYNSRSTFLNGKSQLHETSMIESVHYCQNHQNKQATYISSLYQNNFQYYCDKCAILLASQGYCVQKICDNITESRTLQQSRNTLNLSAISHKSSKSNRSMLSNSRAHNNVVYSSMNRRQQINKFLNLTKDLMGQIEFKKQEIHENLIQSQQFYGMQIQEVNQYFELVFKSLQLEKNKCYNYILNQRLQVQQPVRMINQMIGQLKQKITTIIEDIEENIETVYQTADDIYRPVIQQYQQNYQDIQMKISKIQITPIEMRKIDFEGVPQSIFYLSDILKDSIQNNCQFVENQKKMHEQLDSLRQSLKENFPQIQPRMLFTKKTSQQNKNFCFSFEAQALRQQLSDQKIIYQTQQ